MVLSKQLVRVLGIVCLLVVFPTFAQGALMNGTFNGGGDWTFAGAASTNGDVSHTADGSGSAYLYMIPDHKVQQSVAVSPNVDYTLSWYSTKDNSIQQSVGKINIYGILGGTDVQIASQDFQPGASWTLYSIDFNTASYDQVKVSFESGVTNYTDYYRLDDVTLVPEPATLGLLGLGLLGLVRRKS